MRVLYVGFDGLGFDVLTMPEFKNFAALIRNGNFGISRPEIAHTLPSWTSINTGLTIEQHGVTSTWQSWYLTVHDKYKYIWDYLHDAGYTCGVLNFPMTQPARVWERDEGWFVAGYPVGAGSYWPPNLPFPAGYYWDWADYVRFTWGQRGPRGAPLKAIPTMQHLRRVEEKRHEFLANIRDDTLWQEHLPPKRWLRSVDFLAVQFPPIDRIGHEMCKSSMQGEEQRAVLPDIWKWCDEALGRLIEYQRPDVILVTSDHGMDVELHTKEGVWALSGLDAATVRVDIPNHRVLPSFLDLLGIPNDLDLSALHREEDVIRGRLEALGYE